MNQIEQINDDLKVAMKDKNEVVISTLRMLKSSIKNREIEIGHDLKNEEIGEVVAKSVKQRKDSIGEYQKGDRNDLVKKEQKEISVLEKYLPKQLDEAEINKIIDVVIKSTGANGTQDIGKIMGKIMPQVKGKTNGSLVSKLVRDKLSR